jgi:phosphatidylserine/phosphatidylglycerophosphate/cardiolipin synthase-like enzyme
MDTDFPKIQVLIGKEFPKELRKLFDEAKTSIDIIVFDWRWYKTKPACETQLFNQSIVRAIRRGVKVRAIVNSNEIIETLTSLGVKAKKLISPRLVHVKMIIIDENVVVVGSHNYTESAFERNFELSVVLRDVETDNRFNKFFNNIYG